MDSAASFLARKILDELDAAASPDHSQFPVLDSPSEYLIAVRLSAFRSSRDWAIVFEKIGASPDPGGHYCIYNTHYAYGPGVTRIAHKRIVHFTADGPEGPTFCDNEDEQGDPVHPDAKVILIGGEPVGIPRVRADYRSAGIRLRSRVAIWKEELLRLLATRHYHRMVTPDWDLASSIRPRCKLMLRLSDWHHPDISGGEVPSQSVSLRGLADSIASKDPSFMEVLQPNTHWLNWPKGGRL